MLGEVDAIGLATQAEALLNDFRSKYETKKTSVASIIIMIKESKRDKRFVHSPRAGDFLF